MMNECMISCHMTQIGRSDWMTYFCDLGKDDLPKKCKECVREFG